MPALWIQVFGIAPFGNRAINRSGPFFERAGPRENIFARAVTNDRSRHLWTVPQALAAQTADIPRDTNHPHHAVGKLPRGTPTNLEARRRRCPRCTTVQRCATDQRNPETLDLAFLLPCSRADATIAEAVAARRSPDPSLTATTANSHLFWCVRLSRDQDTRRPAQHSAKPPSGRSPTSRRPRCSRPGVRPAPTILKGAIDNHRQLSARMVRHLQGMQPADLDLGTNKKKRQATEHS